MEALDLLKKDWQRDKHESVQVSENQIYGMLHKKSSSIVKWILIVCLLEFVLSLLLSFSFNDNSLLKKFEHYIANQILIVSYVFGYLISVYFFYRFYINYTRIKTTVTVKKLISDILQTRKTVKQYVWFNIIYGFFIGIIATFIQLNNDKNLTILIEKATKSDHLLLFYSVVIIVVLLFFGIILLFVFLYYKLLYGFLLKRLYKNYEELKKIDF
jgi:hypothetical protein